MPNGGAFVNQAALTSGLASKIVRFRTLRARSRAGVVVDAWKMLWHAACPAFSEETAHLNRLVS
jgi:hypothetical protein